MLAHEGTHWRKHIVRANLRQIVPQRSLILVGVQARVRDLRLTALRRRLGRWLYRLIVLAVDVVAALLLRDSSCAGVLLAANVTG